MRLGPTGRCGEKRSRMSFRSPTGYGNLDPERWLKYHRSIDPETQTRKAMTKTVQAVYENGVLRPLDPVNLSENARVTVTIANGSPTPSDEAWLDSAFRANCPS